MVSSVKISRFDYDAAGFRYLARSEKNAVASRRLLALAMCLSNEPRQDIATHFGMSAQSLRDLVVRYNAEGLAALHNRRSHVRRCFLTKEQCDALCVKVEAGADLERDGVVRFRRIDLVRLIERDYNVIYAERSVGTLLKNLGFSHISARPKHPSGDNAAQEAFKKTSRAI